MPSNLTKREIVLEIYGKTGFPQKEVQQTVQRLGLGGAVTFTGHRMDVRDILAVSNLVYSLSRQPESSGRSVREALSLGVPVIGYDHGGVGETLQLAYPAGRVTPGDPDALEAVTLQLLQHPVEVAPQDFSSVQDMVDATIAVYRELVGA